MPAIKFYDHEPIPVEMHKVKIVQQLQLLPADQRLEKMKEAGFNTFQLHNGDIYRLRRKRDERPDARQHDDS